MAKDNRVIRNAVRTADGQVYGEGREDELEAVLTKEDLQRHLDDGSLEGDWTAKGKAAPAAEHAQTEQGGKKGK